MLDQVLAEQQTGGTSLDAPIDRDWLLEDGNYDAFMLYYFPRDFLSFESLNYRLVEFLEHTSNGLALLPAGHGKTTTLGKWMIYVMCREPQISFIYVEKNQPTAFKRSRAIIQELESNKRLKEHFGEFKGDPWSHEAFTVAQRPHLSQWPSASFYGARGAALGNRCNIFICDDVVEEDTASSELERQRLLDWFGQAAATCPYALPLTRSHYLRKLIVCGTTFHMDDLYHTLLKRGGYDFLHLPAVNPDGSTLSPRFLYREPEELNRLAAQDDWYADLKAKVDRGEIVNLFDFKQKYGTRYFLRRYQNEVTDPTMQVFPELWFNGGADEFSPPGGYPGCLDESRHLADTDAGFEYVTGIDPAAGAKTKASVNFACVTLGWNPKEPTCTYLVDLDYGQYELSSDNPDRKTQVNVVLDMVKRYSSRLVIETNNIQGVYDGVLRTEASRRGLSISVSGHTTTKLKKEDTELGIEAMQPMVENGYLRIPYASPSDRKKVGQLVDEMVFLGTYATDDVLMAFWFAWRYIERRRRRQMARTAHYRTRPVYMNRGDEWHFPATWTQERRDAYLYGEKDGDDE